MARPKTGAQIDRERKEKAQREREDRMRSWSQARNEGIREGLLMAMTACHDLPGDQPFLDVIKARGNRHFGDEEWQTKPRPK